MYIQGILSIPARYPGGAATNMPMMQKNQTMQGLRKLDPQTVGAIYDQYFPEVYRYIRYRINEDALAEDITSEVFVRLLEAVRKRQGPQSNLKGWLFATASNAVNDHLRRKYRRPTQELSEFVADKGLSVHAEVDLREQNREDRKSTRLNSSHQLISYA